MQVLYGTANPLERNSLVRTPWHWKGEQEQPLHAYEGRIQLGWLRID